MFAPARPSSSQSGASVRGDNFKVPFDVDVRPRPLPGAQSLPTERWWPAMPWRHTQVWYVNPCVGSAASWGPPGLEATWTDELTMPGFTIGSLAGNTDNLFSSTSSPYDSIKGSSNYSGAGSGSSLSFGYGPPASLCGAPGFGND